MIRSFIYKIRNNKYKLLLFKLFVCLIITLFLDFFIGNLLKYYYFKLESGTQYRTTYSVEKTNSDILIFGTSRANKHYHPDVFRKRLNLSYYNVGYDGGSILYDYAVLKSILNRFSPKIIFLDFNIGSLKKDQDSYDRLSCLLPYYKNHDEMRSIINLKSPYEKVKLLSSIYPYNSSILTIFIGNGELSKYRIGDLKGYTPLYKTWDGISTSNNISPNYDVDSIKIKIYESFILDCIKSNVKLYIVCSPYPLLQNDISIKLGQKIAKQHNIMFLDYSKDSLFMNTPKLFADSKHLNNDGAIVFSNILIDDISIICKNNKSK